MDECDNPVVVSIEKFTSQLQNEGVAEPSAENSDQEHQISHKEPNIDDKEALLEQDLRKLAVEEDAAVDAEVEAVIMVPLEKYILGMQLVDSVGF